MKIGMLINTNDSETLWNAVRFANLCLENDDDVTIFLNSKGVEYEQADRDKFNIKELVKLFVLSGGRLLACGKCLGFRGSEGGEFCQKGSQKDLYEMVVKSDKLLSF